MATAHAPRRPRRTARLAVAWAMALLVLLGGPRLDAHGHPFFVVQYWLVSATPTAEGPEYVFRARLLNLGPAIPGATARLAGTSSAATVIDGELSFGPVARFGAAWSTDAAAIRRHGRWLDIIKDLRWVVALATANRPPVAVAGPDQTARPLDTVVLDGSVSSDPDGDPISYRWTLLERPDGSAAALSDTAAVRPAFVVDVPGRYLASLVVHDGRAESAPDVVEVSTVNSRPIADAGADQRVDVGTTARLDGSASTDVDGDALGYQWSLVSRPVGSVATLVDAASVMPSLAVDVPGTYVAELVVSDGFTTSDPDRVLVSTVNLRPVAAAGPDQTVPAGQVVLVDGSGSSDADGDPLSYRWTLVSTPTGSTAVLAQPDAPLTSFVADLPGDFVVQLVVNDGALDSEPDTLVVSTLDSPPTADAGPDQANVVVGTTVTLDGSASSDPDGQPLRFAWSLISQPSASTATLEHADTAFPSFTADAPGTYIAQLIVHDGVQPSAPDVVVITVVEPDPVVGIRVTVATVDENGTTPGLFTLFRLGNTATALEVFYTASGTATAGADYAALSGVAAFAPGAAETTIEVTPLDDDLFEGVERVTLNLQPGAGYRVDALDQASVTILDDERPAVTIVVRDDTASEAGPDAGAFEVSRTGPLTAPLTVDFTVAGTAQQGVDYQDLGGRLTIPAGAATAVLPVVPIDDALIEGAELVAVTLAPGPDYVVVVPGIAAIQIADDDLSAVSVEAVDAEAAEAGLDPGAFRLRRTGSVSAPLTVRIGRGGSAIDTDYQPLGAFVTFPVGAETVDVPVVPRADNLVEGVEQLTVTILPDLDYVVGVPGAATVTIADDPAVVTVMAPVATATEAGLVPGSFLYTRSGGNRDAALSISVTIGGTGIANRDYAVLSGVVTFAAGQATASIAVVPLADNVIEPDETVVATINPSVSSAYSIGASATATVTIVDDPAVVEMLPLDPEASEVGPDPGAVLVRRTGGDLSAPLNVFFQKGGTATNGVDYQNLGGGVSLVTIPAGQQAATVTVVPIPDALVEGSETVVLTLVGNAAYVIGASSSTAVTIADAATPVP